ncbi:hypothetical protein C9994_02260 [Marivirga lumbricoides]|uniref:Toxin-antitoxin system YwqK family antitoxin n=1 Tax=Marivirga lumbricoides TaxID=1046115 RepID=A0A2T4DUX7_9BACT|nr:hypothetical protein C9994_02260 [Marivirga lumbricoides]
MKKIFYFIIISLIILSCNERYKEYYSSGELKLICDEKRDTIYIGECLKLSPTGDTIFLKKFSNAGLLHGETKFYDSLGNLSEIFNYNSGLADGLYKSFYDNGSIKERGQYRNHNPYGIFISYDSSGNIILKKEYFIYEEESKVNQYWNYSDNTIDLVKSNFIVIDHLKDSIYIELQPLFKGTATVHIFDENMEKSNTFKMKDYFVKIPISGNTRSNNYIGYVEETKENTFEDKIEIRARRIYFNLNSDGTREFTIP